MHRQHLTSALSILMLFAAGGARAQSSSQLVQGSVIPREVFVSVPWGSKSAYEVPSYWLLADDGTMLAEPFRGNVYHPHGAKVSIRYAFTDVDAAVQRLLAAGAAQSSR